MLFRSLVDDFGSESGGGGEDAVVADEVCSWRRHEGGEAGDEDAWLRLFGVRIGRRVFLGQGFAQVVGPDMLHFEDDSTVVNLFQAHSFEDRVLERAPVHIRKKATVRTSTVMLYGADIGEGAIVAEQSVIMKNECLLPGRHYIGAPTQN